ncbi:MAG TPA: serine hydrolase [Isosphaeraceae bacterium]|nr:serine hydrolase [Isosphaeraceae bacterium]
MTATLLAVSWLVLAVGPDAAPDAKVQSLAEPLVTSGEVSALSLGVVVDGESRTYRVPEGSSSDSKVDDRFFEIGSITKTFTGILLADMVVRGEVRLDDPVRFYLPDDVTVPAFEGREITLVDLATHTSGLPRLPSNFRPKDAENPYVDYSVKDLYDFLSNYKLLRRPGSKMSYSNLGVGLLGHALGRKAGKDYETLLRERVLEPLQLHETALTLDDRQKERLAPGHGPDGERVSNWDFTDTSAAAGGIKSTISDMLKYLKANMEPESTRLAEAIALSHKPAGDPEGTGGKVGLGWMINPTSGVIWHNGGTGGYRSFIGLLPEKNVGSVVLCNTALMDEPFVDRLGDSLLATAMGREVKPIAVRVVKAVDPDVLERCVGRYRQNLLFVMTITREGDRLYAQLTGQSKFRIYPTSDTDFFYRVVKARITFEPGEDGRMAKLVLHQNGREIPATRIEEKKD